MSSKVTFAELGLPDELVQALAKRRIEEPFEIQAQAIPDAVLGRDILGRAPTGSGKTLAFGLPLLTRLEPAKKKRPRGLILSPTRELAEQICRELEPLAKAMNRSVLAVYGGIGLTKQITTLRKGVDIVVACPGRLLDLIEQKALTLDDADIVVVDEADRMADMGFLPDVRRILDQTSETRQTVMFSATLDKEVQVLIDKYQDDPIVHEVGEVEPDLTLVDHRFIKVPKTDRVWLAADVIADAGPTVIFVRTRHGVDRLARQLKAEGIKSGYIHGGRSQSQRDRALQVFVDGKVDALVATDVAARGIHVDGVACVIHYDPPADMKDYVHRSGRTARAGADGMVVSFLDPPQVKESKKMQRKLNLESEIEPLPERKPRSSRPDAIDDRRKPAARGGTSRSRKPNRGTTQGERPRRDRDRTERSERRDRSERSDGRDRRERNGRSESSERSNAEFKPRGGKPGGSKNPRSRRSSANGQGNSANGEKPKGSAPKEAGKTPAKGSAPTGAGKGPAKGSGKGGASKGPASKGRSAGKAKAKASRGATKPKSKRSGKPRPKNRKNRAKA